MSVRCGGRAGGYARVDDNEASHLVRSLADASPWHIRRCDPSRSPGLRALLVRGEAILIDVGTSDQYDRRDNLEGEPLAAVTPTQPAQRR